MTRFLAIGECMIEMSQAGSDGLYKKGFAGDTFNTAWYAARLAPVWLLVEYFSAVGTDRASEEMLDFMACSKIGTAGIQRIPDRGPGLYIIHTDNGERSFSYWRESSAARRLADDCHSLQNAIDGSDIIYFSGITLAILPSKGCQLLIELASRARARGKLVVFDPNLRPSLWSSNDQMIVTTEAAASASSLIMPSFDDEVRHFGDISPEATMKRYQSLANCRVVLKDGANGIYFCEGGEVGKIPAHPARAIVDTTAAGDSFNGAFIVAQAMGKDVREAARFAAEIAAMVISHPGALIEPKPAPPAG